MTERLVRKQPKIAGKKCKHLVESIISWVTEDHLTVLMLTYVLIRDLFFSVSV